MAFTYVVITHTFETAADSAAGGTVDFTPIVPMHNGLTVVKKTVTATLNATGAISQLLAANTDPDTTPTGTTYQVTERITGQTPFTYYVQVPHDQGASLDLRTLAGWEGGPGGGGGGTVSSINGEGPDGLGNIVLSASDVGAQPADGDLTGLAALGDGVPRRASGTWGLVTGTPDGTKFLRDDGTWASASGSSYTDEQVRDVIGAALVAGPNVTITPNDGADTITITAASTGSSGIPASTVDAKGDLIAGTANDTVARKSVGTDGQALLADSAQTTGLAWGAPVPADSSVTNAKVATGAAISADKLADGTTNKIMTSTERTKVTNSIDGTLADAKGDLLAATAADTWARLPVGSAGQVLGVNAATSTGLQWTTVSGTGNLKYLDEFYGGTGDYTAAFAAASSWSTTNRAPVYIKPSATAYVTSSPIAVGLNCQFIGSYQPAWATNVVAADASVIIQPSATFPTATNRGLFEIGADARNSALRGLSLQGVARGTSIHGILLNSSAPELGLLLQDLDIGNFSGDGIRGGTRVTFLNRLMIHENGGYGININSPWYDSRTQYVYCFYNKTGGLNIDSDAQLDTFFNCRFERSGQIYNDPQNALGSPNWNTNAPGIRMRGGQKITFFQCDTDANTGPGIDVAVSSATPTYSPVNCSFVACSINRDSQGDAINANATGSGIKVRGFANIGGQTVTHFRFIDCSVSAYYSNDTGTPAQINPARGVWIENTEFIRFETGGQIDGNTTKFYFGSSTNPTANNWRPWFSMPQYGVVMPAWQETTPFTTTGMLREGDTSGRLERFNGTNWQTQVPVSGTATVTSAATSVVVTHGLGGTPSIQNISITPTNNLGSSTKFWVSNPTSTQFTINATPAPGVTTATFGWQASL